ncbi:hypothetical protein BCON_0029g00380 [Botryotinia convoluta]|uniref:Uncharacterized protein n=1 Tax=Botryotinia convoluta TaxID=54673 RepID=A0A4Z1IIJ8_9HELO|nr:hypothetical protein BCON_0029g00380 [Botryotinia convoluta]
MFCIQWDENTENYLRKVIDLSSGKSSGGVPSTFPSSIFEITSTFLKVGLSPEALGLEQMENVDSGILADVDDTAKSTVATNLLNLTSDPTKMITEF